MQLAKKTDGLANVYMKDGLKEAREIIDLEISIWEAGYGQRTKH